MADSKTKPLRSFRPTRRQFIAGAIGLPLFAGAYTRWVEPHWLELVRRDLPIRNLPPSLQGKRLVQLTDLHIGPQVADEYLLETFRRVQALEADFVVHTGDLVSYRGQPTLEQARRLLAHCPRGRLGTVAVLGNHDYGTHWADLRVAAQVSEVLQAAGATVLRNARTSIEGLHFVGLDDLWARRFWPGLAFASFDFDQPALALAHNPDTCDLPGWASYQGWILSGHTHGGQCKAPFLRPPLLPVQNARYTSGEFALEGGRRLYISRGVGHLLKARFNARPEVTVFRLIVS